MTVLSDNLRRLSADSLEELSDYFDALSKAAGAHATAKGGRAERAAYNARQAMIFGCAKIVAARAQSMSIERALDQVAQETGLPAETVACHWRLRLKKLEARRRWQRDRRIMRLARLGYSNGEIGGRLALHPGTVSRIIQTQLKAGR